MNSRTPIASRRAQNGFTMIELIVVIVILGILAATALPKFIDLRSNAAQAALDGVAGNIASAMSTNYAACAASNNATTGVGANRCFTVNNCIAGANLLQGITGNTTGVFVLANNNYTIASLNTNLNTNGGTVACTLSTVSGGTTLTSNFMGIGAGN